MDRNKARSVRRERDAIVNDVWWFRGGEVAPTVDDCSAEEMGWTGQQQVYKQFAKPTVCSLASILQGSAVAREGKKPETGNGESWWTGVGEGPGSGLSTGRDLGRHALPSRLASTHAGDSAATGQPHIALAEPRLLLMNRHEYPKVRE